jgi:phosphate-selective porin
MDCVKTVTPLGNTLTGLEVFEGKKVRVFDLENNRYYGDYDIQNPKTVEEGGNIVQIDDLDFDGYTVTNGQITLPDYITLSDNVHVGIPYYAVMETIPLEFSDQNGNSTIGRKKTITDAYLRYGDSRGVSYKTLGKEYDCGIAKKDTSDSAEFLERGQIRLDVASEYKWDSTIKILQRQPYPARIESITLGLNFNDKS